MKKSPCPSAQEQARDLLAELKRTGTKKRRDEMGPKYGIHTDKAFGVAMSDLQKIAKRTGRDHALAAALWQTGWYDARMLAALVDQPAEVTPAQMDLWCKDFDNWAICDTVCFHLFNETPHALTKVKKWSRSRDEFTRRAAFALLACTGLPDGRTENLTPWLSLIENAATDGRHFVKKGVNWALRSLGSRNHAFHTASLALAGRLAGAENPAARWIGKDAQRQLQSAATLKRVARGTR